MAKSACFAFGFCHGTLLNRGARRKGEYLIGQREVQEPRPLQYKALINNEETGILAQAEFSTWERAR